MPITNEFIESFKQLVEQYSQSTSRGLLWKREDVHFESIKNSLIALFDIITVNKDMFDDLSLIDYLSRSAVKLLVSDYQFVFAVHQFCLNYDKKNNRISNSSLDTGLYVHVNRNDPPAIDLIKQLQSVISIMKKAHESEISAFEHQIKQLVNENEHLRKENDSLKKEFHEQILLKKRSEQLDQIKILIQKMNQVVNLSNLNESIPYSLVKSDIPIINQLSTQTLSNHAIPTALLKSEKLDDTPIIQPIPKAPPPPDQPIIKSSIFRASSKTPSSFFQELTTTIQAFEARKKQTSKILNFQIEKNQTDTFTNLCNEIAININSRRKSIKDDDEVSGEELNREIIKFN